MKIQNTYPKEVCALWAVEMNERASRRDFETTFASLLMKWSWTFILVTIYFALGTIVSAYGCWRFFNKPVIHNGAKAEFLRRDVEETISTNLITSNKLESRYVEEDFQQRAGFWGFVMQTIYQPFPWFRVSYFVLWSCGYVIFQWVIHAFGFKWWPYPFLELNNKWAPIWYLCLAVIHAPCHMACIIWIVRAKNTILPRLFPRAFLS
ncbi:hypothetical protein GmHk_03G008674 [Glycine max]|nr:hypothetical protein GmHk_03G008674 [Glycine max]